MLPLTVPLLLQATSGDNVRILWVCNGCTDDSAAIIRRLAGTAGEVIELAEPGKTGALQAGDAAFGGLFPRIYLDADTWMDRGGPARLIQPLLHGKADLVAPRLRHDPTGASGLSVRVGACWLALPHGQTAAFSNAIGVSAVARALWEKWPQLTGDDIFIAAQVPAHRKQIVPEVEATIPLPANFAGWVRMRARWLKGESELKTLGLCAERPPRQRRALLRLMFARETALGAWAFAGARILAKVTRSDTLASAWIPDR